MFSFKAIVQKFAAKGEKTGWTYIDIPPDILLKFKLDSKKAFRIKGFIDDVPFAKTSTYPMGNGEFIMALNNDLRKKIKKTEGAMVLVKMALDNGDPLISKELILCLKEDKPALKQFESQLLSHQNYFHRYVESAKTPATKAIRIANTINAMHLKQNYGEMIRSLNKKNA